MMILRTLWRAFSGVYLMLAGHRNPSVPCEGTFIQKYVLEYLKANKSFFALLAFSLEFSQGHEFQVRAPANWTATLHRGGVLRVKTRLVVSLLTSAEGF
jgi:hypothetical protein